MLHGHSAPCGKPGPQRSDEQRPKMGAISFWVACPPHVKGIFWKSYKQRKPPHDLSHTAVFQKYYLRLMFLTFAPHLKPHPKFAIYFDNSTQPQKMMKPKGGSTKDIRIAAVMQMTPTTADPLNSVPCPYLLLSQYHLIFMS